MKVLAWKKTTTSLFKKKMRFLVTLILKEGRKIEDLKLFEKKKRGGMKNILKTKVELKLFDKLEF